MVVSIVVVNVIVTWDVLRGFPGLAELIWLLLLLIGPVVVVDVVVARTTIRCIGSVLASVHPLLMIIEDLCTVTNA